MTYKYENFKRVITIREGQVGHTDQRLVGVTVTDQSVEAMCFVKAEDAPTLALAILEASGVKGRARDDSDVDRALEYLRCHEDGREGRESRALEDVNVRAFIDAIPGASWPGADHEACRELYLAAREFFKDQS